MPPIVKKQTPVPPKRVSPPKTPINMNDDVFADAVPVGEMSEDYIKIVIYGQNRVGKTTLACQFPKPLLLISFEPAKSGGAKSVKLVQGVTYLRITSTQQALKLAQRLRNDRRSNWELQNGRWVPLVDSSGRPSYTGAPFATDVVDTATSYQDIILQEILDLSEIPEQLDWGMVDRDQYRDRASKTKEALRPFLAQDANTVICAKEKDHNPPDKEKPKILRGFQIESFFASDLGGATVGWLHDACDYIARLYIEREMKEITTKTTINKVVKEMKQMVETGKNVRRLRTMYHPNFAAGFRSCTPDRVPEFIEDPTYEKILKVIQGG